MRGLREVGFEVRRSDLGTAPISSVNSRAPVWLNCGISEERGLDVLANDACSIRLPKPSVAGKPAD